ncbi:MAG: pseudouridine synthase [Siculibacillus sp.]|nr:pseudouridine synthase [Siculibacillus sp.]
MTKSPIDETARASDAKGGDLERIAKVLARAGLCSRREAEEWVTAGRVTVDGVVLTTPAVTVGPQNRITVDGAPLPARERTRLWLFHKPRGLVTTTSDPEGRPTVFSVLPDDMPRVITVGRLDINTEGLLLLTNDGGLARVLELPSTGWLRRYRVRAYGEIDQAALDELKHGVSLDGVDYGPIEAMIDRVQGSNIWLVLGLREGKNREVKRVLASLGLTVNRLIRISFGPFQLADLEEGEIREIRGRVLRDQLGKRLVTESGADFDAPIVHHLHGSDEGEEAPKRRIKGFTPAGDGDDRAKRGGKREPRTKMEFVGTGERRRDERRGRDEESGGRSTGERNERPMRSEGFRGRPSGAPKSGGFRDRPEIAGGGRVRAEGYRDRSGPTGEGGRWRSEGSRGRAEGSEAPRSGGFRDRPAGDRPKSAGFRDRPQRDERPSYDEARKGGRGGPKSGERPRGAGERTGRGERPEGEERGRFRSEGFRDRGAGGEGRRRSEGFRDRPEGGAKSGGFRDRPEGGAKSGGFRDRPEGGDRPKGAGFKARPEGSSFGPRGPRGMNPGGKKGPRDGSDGGAPASGGRGRYDGPSGRGTKGPDKRGPGPKGPRPGGGRGGPRGGRP